jgi:hypothetical protein
MKERGTDASFLNIYLYNYFFFFPVTCYQAHHISKIGRTSDAPLLRKGNLEKFWSY